MNINNFIAFILLFTASSFANANSEVLMTILLNEQVKESLSTVDNYLMEFNAENKGTTWTFTATFEYNKSVIEGNGIERELLCVLVAESVSIGGVAGPVELGVQTSETCN